MTEEEFLQQIRRGSAWAAEDLRTLICDNPRVPQLHYFEGGYALLIAKNWDHAMVAFRKARVLDLANFRYRFLLSYSCFRKGFYDSAWYELNRLSNLNGHEERFSLLGHTFIVSRLIDEMRSFIKRAVGQNQKFRDRQLEIGKSYLNYCRFKRAAEVFEYALLRDPNDLDIWFSLGLAHIGASSYQQAITDFLQAIKISPNHLDSLRNLGRLYLATGQVSEARQIFIKVLRVHPNDACTLTLLKNLEQTKPRRESESVAAVG